MLDDDAISRALTVGACIALGILILAVAGCVSIIGAAF